MKRADQVTTVLIILITLGYLAVSTTYPPGARVVPGIIGVAILVLAVIQLIGPKVRVLVPFVGTFEPGEEAEAFTDPQMRRRLLLVCASLLVLPALILLLGIVVALPVYVALFVHFLGRKPGPVTAACTVAMVGVSYFLLLSLLGLPWDDGWIWAWR